MKGLRKIFCLGATEIPWPSSFDQKQSTTDASPELTHRSDDARAAVMPKTENVTQLPEKQTK